MHSYKTEGIILKRINYGEADRIITIFTKEHGKLRVIAKGVRKITSKRSSNIELFNHVRMGLHKGHNMDIVTEVEVVNTFTHIRDNLQLVGLTYHICELVEGLCADSQPQQASFELLLSTIKEIDVAAIHTFEIELLCQLGFWSRNVPLPTDNTTFLEQLLDRKLKSRRMLSKLS